jgi:hypothetical protein
MVNTMNDKIIFFIKMLRLKKKPCYVTGVAVCPRGLKKGSATTALQWHHHGFVARNRVERGAIDIHVRHDQFRWGVRQPFR